MASSARVPEGRHGPDMVELEATNWTVVGELMVSFFLPGPIAPELWTDFCDTVASATVRKLLIASIGAVEVDAAQRGQINRALQVAPNASVAVITDEALVRGLMTATSWLGRVRIETFAWHEIDEAHQRLAPADVSEARVRELVELVRRRVEDASR